MTTTRIKEWYNHWKDGRTSGSPSRSRNDTVIDIHTYDYVNSDQNLPNFMTTGHKTWVYGHDPETKMQLSEWQHPLSPRLKKARQVHSNVKVNRFLCSRGEVHHKAKLSQRSTTFVAFVMLCGSNKRLCGRRKLESSIIITRLPILRIWFRLS